MTGWNGLPRPVRNSGPSASGRASEPVPHGDQIARVCPETTVNRKTTAKQRAIVPRRWQALCVRAVFSDSYFNFIREMTFNARSATQTTKETLRLPHCESIKLLRVCSSLPRLSRSWLLSVTCQAYGYCDPELPDQNIDQNRLHCGLDSV